MLLKRWGGLQKKRAKDKKKKKRCVCVEGGGGPLDKCISIKD